MRKGFQMSLNKSSTQLLESVSSINNSNPDLTNQQVAIEILNHILADESVLNLKTRSARWSLKGLGFYDLYSIFEVQCKQLNDISDEISTRIQMLGGQQIGSFNEFQTYTRLTEQPGKIFDPSQLLADHECVVGFLREDYKKCSKELEDFSTADLLISLIRQHEKMAWMFRSFLKSGSINNEKQENLLATTY
jgi:starvation-inducible DNA-binding protein